MREFNKREKSFIEKLVQIKPDSMTLCSRFLQEEFFTKSTGRALIIIPSKKHSLLYIKQESFTNIEIARKTISEFLEILMLLSYLKDNRYITSIPVSQISALYAMHSEFDASIKQNGDVINLNEDGMHVLFSKIDEIRNVENEVVLKGLSLNDYYDFINEIVSSIILPTEDLIELVKNKFKSKEDRKHSQSMRIAWSGIVIAIIIGLVGLIGPFNKQETLDNPIEKITKEITVIKNNTGDNVVETKKILQLLTRKDTIKIIRKH